MKPTEFVKGNNTAFILSIQSEDFNSIDVKVPLTERGAQELFVNMYRKMKENGLLPEEFDQMDEED